MMAAAPDNAGAFALLAHSLGSMIEREERDLEILRHLEDRPMEQKRPQGLEWAISTLVVDLDRTRQARELLSALAPIEEQVRMLLSIHEMPNRGMVGGAPAILVHFAGERT